MCGSFFLKNQKETVILPTGMEQVFICLHCPGNQSFHQCNSANYPSSHSRTCALDLSEVSASGKEAWKRVPVQAAVGTDWNWPISGKTQLPEGWVCAHALLTVLPEQVLWAAVGWGAVRAKCWLQGRDQFWLDSCLDHWIPLCYKDLHAG